MMPIYILIISYKDLQPIMQCLLPSNTYRPSTLHWNKLAEPALHDKEMPASQPLSVLHTDTPSLLLVSSHLTNIYQDNVYHRTILLLVFSQMACLRQSLLQLASAFSFPIMALLVLRETSPQ